MFGGKSSESQVQNRINFRDKNSCFFQNTQTIKINLMFLKSILFFIKVIPNRQ
jgi:hypothetical protein